MSDAIASYPPPTAAYKRLIRRVLSERMRVRAWSAVASTPVVAELYASLDPRARALRVTRRTEVLIDGYPRSANTYAVAAFDYANGPGRVALSHHFHHIRQIERAVCFAVPAIVLIRDPREVLGSLVQFSSAYAPSRALKSYERFYARVLPLVDDVVVADFHEVISDFGSVIERCNAKFGTSFRPYVRTAASEDAVRRAIERIARDDSPEEFENRVSRPSAKRLSAEEIVAGLKPRERAALVRAQAVYDEVLTRAGAASLRSPGG
jgi:hypothetical protein